MPLITTDHDPELMRRQQEILAEVDAAGLQARINFPPFETVFTPQAKTRMEFLIFTKSKPKPEHQVPGYLRMFPSGVTPGREVGKLRIFVSPTKSGGLRVADITVWMKRGDELRELINGLTQKIAAIIDPDSPETVRIEFSFT